jgi:hypothetical protein
VKCRVCELAMVLQLHVVTICKWSINPITNPNHIYSHTLSCDNNNLKLSVKLHGHGNLDTIEEGHHTKHVMRIISKTFCNYNFFLKKKVKSSFSSYNHPKRNTQTLIDASKETGLEVNTEKTKYILLSHHQNAGQN